MNIVYIDDKSEMRAILHRYLTAWGYDAVGAADGESGWELIRTLCPDIVITDWMMPVMDGLELCRRIRSAELPSYIYIILLTARNMKEDLVTGMEAGADDFVGKPFDKQELKARINAAARIITLERNMQENNRELEQKNQQLSEAYEVIREDLEAAARIQRSLIPQNVMRFGGLTYDWLFCPSQFVGGDIFNITSIDEHNLAFYLLDVSGHGIPAALLSTSLSRVLTPSPNFTGPIRRPLSEPPYYRITPPREVASELNERFMSNSIQVQYFTMVYGTICIESGKCVMTQAGHPSPIHQTADGEVRLIGDGGFPVGMFPGVEYEEYSFALEQEERLFLYSDGITECRGIDAAMFGLDRLLDIIRDGYNLPLRAVMERIEQELAALRGCDRFEDDISLLAVERRN